MNQTESSLTAHSAADRQDAALGSLASTSNDLEATIPQDGRTTFSATKASLILVGLSFVWACMVWWIQHLTTTPTLWKEPSMLIKDHIFRFLLDWSLATILFSLLSPRILTLFFAVNLWLTTAIVSFFLNYQRALSWLTIRSQAGEGAAVFMVALEDASPYLAVLVPLSVALIFTFTRLRARLGRQPRLAGLATLIWISVFVGVHLDHKPLYRLASFETADGIAHSYGFVSTWFAEGHYINLEGISTNAIERLSLPTNRLLKSVEPVEIGERLAVIQVESLDDAVRNLRIRGIEVVPRLNQWAAKGTLLRVQAPKVNGSCDSDFALLFGALPSRKMAPYRVPNFPFDLSLVNRLNERGWDTSFYHGVNGTFFERRTAFSSMKFDRMVFREELIERLGIEDPQWTISDGKMYQLAQKERVNHERFFEFSITGTSHTPFRFSLDGHKRKIFPHKSHRSYTYFDTIAYVDEVIGKYVDSLPEGTVVVIYGDHWSRVENDEVGYHSQLIDEFGIVPVVLFRKVNEGIEPLFQIEEEIALGAQLRLVDMTSWLRQSLKIAPAHQQHASRATDRAIFDKLER